MSNHTFSSINISAAPSPEELRSLQQQVEAPKAAPVQVQGETKGRITFHHDGSMTSEGLGVQRAQIASRHPDRVTINGTETSRAAAIAAGLLADDESADPDPARNHKTYDEEMRRLREGERQSGIEPKATVNEQPTEKGPDDETPSLAVQAASATLEAIATAHGADVVEAHLWASAESGDLPANLPEGVSQEQAQTVRDGYAAAADGILAEVGSSVSLLQEMLTDAELADARKATVANDQGWLKDLGKKAVTRLETLPDDPMKFQGLLDTLSPEQRKLIVKHNDKWMLRAGGAIPDMQWGTAVRQGIIKF